MFLLFNDAKDAYIEFIRVKVGKRERVCALYKYEWLRIVKNNLTYKFIACVCETHEHIFLFSVLHDKYKLAEFCLDVID